MDQETTEPEPQGAQEYIDANEQVSVFGVEMRLDTRKVERDIQGLLVIDTEPGSPGAAAGLHPFRERTRDVLNGVGMLAAMVFPPAIVVVPIVESVPLHEGYDLIIGVDVTRVSNFANLRERMRMVRPGGISLSQPAPRRPSRAGAHAGDIGSAAPASLGALASSRLRPRRRFALSRC